MNKKTHHLLKLAIVALLIVVVGNISGCKQPEQKTNFIVVFCDDLGFGDLGCFGHPTIKTPTIDSLASEGQKWTSFYAAASVCTPSRAGLVTGRLPIRNGMCGKKRVLFPNSAGGLPQSEITIAKALKEVGYSTACIGKWHLGHYLPEFLPTNHGFDYYYGIPYSNDMGLIPGISFKQAFGEKSRPEFFNVPLMRNEDIIEQPAEQTTITKRYTEETVRFIEENKNNPFFIYFAHSMVHVPLFCSADFVGVSERGLYGDVVEEIDWSVRQIMKTLKKNNLEENTMVVFTSDNGPWLTRMQQGGSSGLLKDGKGTTYEGGVRVPALFWWKGKIAPGTVSDMGSTLDLFPTICDIANVKMPNDRIYDGYSLTPTLLNDKESPRKEFIFYRNDEVYAYRKGNYKAHFTTNSAYKGTKPVKHDTPLLYHMGHDPSEQFNIAHEHPDIVQAIIEEVKNHQSTLKPVENQTMKVIPKPAKH